MPHRSCTAQSLSIAAQILRCRGTFFFCYSGAIFERSRSLSIDYSAQNIPVFLRKSTLHKKHFFAWLKTENFSTACGTVTLKSPLSRESDAPHVHPRPRKHPPRCTLDCGFKTPESPALRGFVAGPRALATAAFYLVLKSNGLRHSKNPPVRFSFSLKIVPATIAKKLPLQLRPKPLFIAFFSLAHKRPTFAFTGESGYTLGFRRRIAHSGLHAETGASPPSATAWSCATSEITLYAVFVTPDSAALLYTYISRFSENPHHQQQLYLRPSFIPIFNFSHKRPTFAFTGESGYTLGSPRKIARKGTHGETRGVLDGGWYHYPRSVPHVHEHPRAGCQNGVFCRFWALTGCAHKEHREPSGQRCAYARRCPEASRPRWAA